MATIAFDAVRLNGGTGSVVVSGCIPLQRGQLTAAGVSAVVVTIGGSEKSIWIEAPAGTFSDTEESLRAVQWWCTHSVDDGTPVAGTMDTAGTPTVARLTAKPASTITWSLSSPKTSGFPACIAWPDADHLVATGLFGSPRTVALTNSTDWETTFTTQAAPRWTAFANLDTNKAITANYYDRAWNHFVYAARLGGEAGAAWFAKACAYGYAYRKIYHDPNRGKAQPHNQQLEGLALHYWLTGDTGSRAAVVAGAITMVNGFPPAKMDSPSDTWIEGRIGARCLMGCLLAWQLGDTSRDWATLADQYVAAQQNLQQSSGEQYPWFCGTSYTPFMVGQRNNAFRKYYGWRSADATIPPWVKLNLDWMWTHEWSSTGGGFQYASVAYNCNGNGGGTSIAPDLNGLIADGYAWYYAFSGNATYATRADTIQAEALDRSFFEGEKQFNEAFYAIWDTLGFLDGTASGGGSVGGGAGSGGTGGGPAGGGGGPEEAPAPTPVGLMGGPWTQTVELVDDAPSAIDYRVTASDANGDLVVIAQGTVTFARPARPAVSGYWVGDTLFAVVVGDANTRSLKVAAQTGSFPTDADVREVPAFRAASGTFGPIATATPGETVYVTAFAYPCADGSGQESDPGTLVIARPDSAQTAIGESGDTVMIWSGDDVTQRLLDVPAAATELSTSLRFWKDLSAYTQVRVGARCVASAVATAEVALQYSAQPLGSAEGDRTWAALSDDDGPSVVLTDAGDLASTAFTDIVAGARGSVILRPVVLNGDDASEVQLGNLWAEFKAAASGTDVDPDPLPEDPATDNPSGDDLCTDAGADDFEGYADTAALLAIWSETDPNAKVGWALIENAVWADGGTNSLQATIFDGDDGLDHYVARTFTGLTPGATHRVSVRCRLSEPYSDTGAQVGIEVEGQRAVIPEAGPFSTYLTLTVEPVADGSGNLEVRLGSFEHDQAIIGGYRHAFFDNLSICQAA